MHCTRACVCRNTVIFLNVVFGIIVDQFAELRDQRKEKDDDRANTCPICNCDVSDDTEGEHLKNEHVRWLVGCVVGWSVGRLVGWLRGWLVG